MSEKQDDPIDPDMSEEEPSEGGLAEDGSEDEYIDDSDKSDDQDDPGCVDSLDDAPELQETEDVEDDASIEDELRSFADLDDLSDEDLADIQEAIAENADDEKDGVSAEEEPQEEFNPEISEELEAKMQAELEAKRKEHADEGVSREKFIKYLGERRNKIVYHALWYLTFNIDDHQASKAALYEALKEVTSKDPVEPLAEHKFYFGLGFILRLKLFNSKVVAFKDGKIKINVNVENLQEILQMVGDPISERPILTKSQKEDMFSAFLKDDFLDI